MNTTLYATDSRPGLAIEQYATAEEAVLECIRMWHEDGKPGAFVVRDGEDHVLATVAPVGSDAAVAVYGNGRIDNFSGIHYDQKATKFYLNGSATHTSLKW